MNPPPTEQVLLLEQHVVAGEELDGHRVRVFEVALGGIVDDVLEAHVDRLVAELYREHLVRLVAQTVQKFRIDRCRFFPDQPGKRGSFRAVSLARRAEASE